MFMPTSRFLFPVLVAGGLLLSGCAEQPTAPAYAPTPGRSAAPEGGLCLTFSPELEHSGVALTLRRALMARGLTLVGEVDATGRTPKACRLKVELSGHWNASATALTDAQLMFLDLATGESRFARYRETVSETDNAFSPRYRRIPDDVVIDLVERLFPEGL